MKSIVSTANAPTEPPTMNVSLAGVAELYAAASALEPNDPSDLKGLGDLARVSMATTAGSVRRLIDALALVRGHQ